MPINEIVEAMKKELGKEVDSKLVQGVAKCVYETLHDALEVDSDEIMPYATLYGDLGAESIDDLDIIFRLEAAFEVRIPRESGIMVREPTHQSEEYTIKEMVDANPRYFQAMTPEQQSMTSAINFYLNATVLGLALNVYDKLAEVSVR